MTATKKLPMTAAEMTARRVALLMGNRSRDHAEVVRLHAALDAGNCFENLAERSEARKSIDRLLADIAEVDRTIDGLLA